MNKNLFSTSAMFEKNPKWNDAIHRETEIYKRENEIRTEFFRDYTRILHSTAYRRLKHKTQVFFATENDHICTRIEHVNHVASVSYIIAYHLGLNTELTNAIAIGHDLGHAPFGHAGEFKLKEIAKEDIEFDFWHEKNSLKFIDNIETLPNEKGEDCNLNLTYAVRDGIVLHCGEVNDEFLFPRKDVIDLKILNHASQIAPYTWEGCVVKIADKISYLGRDIEDAISLKILSFSQLRELQKILKSLPIYYPSIREINNTFLMHNFIINLCRNSNPDEGIKFSKEYFNFIRNIKNFNYENIYKHDKLKQYIKYSNLIIETIYKVLKDFYKDNPIDIFKILDRGDDYRLLCLSFKDYLLKYMKHDKIDLKELANFYPRKKISESMNRKIYDITDRRDYLIACIDFISGMTDNYALKNFDEIMTFS